MDFHFISFLIFLTSTYCSGQNFKEIDCQTEGRIQWCPPGKQCTASCPALCSSERQGKLIRGTRIYSGDSPICRSAVHDYRIPPGSSKMNVTFVKSAEDARKYLGSIQQGISSTFFGNFKGYFYFSSPYFTEEEILDVSTLTFLSLYPRSGSFIQECRISGEAIIQDFQFYIPNTAIRIGDPTAAGGQEVTWTKPALQPGGYWCNIVDNTYSDVMSLAMAHDADAIPEQWTLTTSINETVVIKFILNQDVLYPRSVTWKKDRTDLVYFPNMRQSQKESGYYLEIENVDVGDAGIYGIQFDQEVDASEKRGVMRLIVRKCRQDYFGPYCDQECPVCQNDGVCHDVMGGCICPPGFYGSYCESRCTPGYFGKSCSQSCASSRHSIGNSCKGALICLPDPYGCSCAAEYKGLACDEEITTTTSTTVTTTTSTTKLTPRPTSAATTPTKRASTAYTTRPTSTTTASTMSPQEKMCETLNTNGRNFSVISNPTNACQYGCIGSGRKLVIPILKADGEQCKHGICVKGVCQETSEKSVCPEDFNGVRSACKEYCYSVQFPGMSILMNVKDGEICIDEDNHGFCMNGKCVSLQKAWK